MSSRNGLFHLFSWPLLVLAVLASQGRSKVNPKSTDDLHPCIKPASVSNAHFDVNAIDCIMSNDGLIVDHRITGSAGMEWPKGTGKTIDYNSGLWLAGIGHDDGLIHTACSEYASELVPGVWGGDLNDEAYRIYKINSDGTGDWAEWPIDQGAPVDEYGDPLLLGDQTLFWVANDGDSLGHENVFSTLPMDVEIRFTVFGFTGDDPLGNIMYIKWELINRGTQQYDSCFVGLWDDPDLGDAADDHIGCDTTLGIGYCYNANSNDDVYGSAPPALGFDFLQGPEEPPGSGNYQPMMAFVHFLVHQYYDHPETALEAYLAMKGYGDDGMPYFNHLGEETKFPCAGDPVTGTGDLDDRTGDRWFLMSSGPFTFAPGDTQVVVGAKIVAQGTSNLNSITELRSFDSFAQLAYENAFADLPKNWTVNTSYQHPSQAEIQIQVGLENVSQAWADFHDHYDVFITSVPLFDDGLHDDQNLNDGIWGNNIAISHHPTALYMNLRDAHPVFGDRDWDQIETNITVAGPVRISDSYIGMDHINSDHLANPGEVIYYTVGIQNQTDFDFQNVTLQQCFALESSWVQSLSAPNGNKMFPTLDSGQTRTWAYDPDSAYYQLILSPDTPANESVHVVFRMTDTDFNIWHDTLAIFVAPIQYVPQYGFVNLVSGITDGRLAYMITHPTLLAGHTYRLYLHEHMHELTYDLVDHTIGETLLFNQELPDIYGLNSQMVAGFRVTQGTAEYLAYGFDWNWTSPGLRWLSWVPWGGALFGGAIGLGKNFLWGNTLSEWEYKNVRIEFDPTGITMTNCKVYRRDLGYEVQPGLGTFHGAAHDIMDLENPRRLNIVFLEDDRLKPADMVWNPDNSWDGAREYLFIMNSDYDPITAGGYDDVTFGPGADVIFAAWTHLRHDHLFLENAAELTLYVNPDLVHDGDVFEFTPIWSEQEQVPKGFSLAQNYPNPFNQTTTIQYALSAPNRVKLNVYNVLGQRVAKLVDEVQGAGIYRLLWDGREYASGVYFCRLEVGDFMKTKKMVLLK